MRIGQVAQQAGCTVETVRFYEQEDLLDPPDRETNGYRRYRDTHLLQLNFIRHCRSLGMALPEIRTLRSFQANPQSACEGINKLMDVQIEQIHAQVAALHELEAQLIRLRSTCQANQQVSECGIMHNLERAAEGDSCRCHSGP